MAAVGRVMASSNTCTCHVCHGIGTIISSSFRVLEVYGWILDAYIVDFYQEDLWSKLPAPWIQTLESASLEELGSWILQEKTRRVWPLSLLALRQLINAITVNRDPTKNTHFVCRSTEWRHNFLQQSTENVIPRDKRLDKFKNLFNRRVKDKKRHEIEKFSEIIAKCRHLSNATGVVDTGAGMGHLARELAYKYRIPIICIEQDRKLTDLAKKYDTVFGQQLKSHLAEFSGSPPQHLCAKIVDESCRGDELPSKFKRIFRDEFPTLQSTASNDDNGFGLIGLHPCGDLAARLLKFYAEQSDAKFISVVGCCYMKLTLCDDEKGSSSALGYPLSKYVSRINGHSLSYAALEVACHALENYCDKIKNNHYDDLKVHAYRAMLEKILIDKGGATMRHGKVGSVKVTGQMSFEEYCKLATEKLDVNRQINISEINHAEVEEGLTKWRRVVAFEAIRFMLAPIVENVILLDRFLFLSEKRLRPMLKAEFEPRLSPRNFVLTSIK